MVLEEFRPAWKLPMKLQSGIKTISTNSTKQ